jgi:hypothetical protein
MGDIDKEANRNGCPLLAEALRSGRSGDSSEGLDYCHERPVLQLLKLCPIHPAISGGRRDTAQRKAATVAAAPNDIIDKP